LRESATKYARESGDIVAQRRHPPFFQHFPSTFPAPSTFQPQEMNQKKKKNQTVAVATSGNNFVPSLLNDPGINFT